MGVDDTDKVLRVYDTLYTRTNDVSSTPDSVELPRASSSSS